MTESEQHQKELQKSAELDLNLFDKVQADYDMLKEAYQPNGAYSIKSIIPERFSKKVFHKLTNVKNK